jgi:UDP-2,3-diacylglucosamine pyrophosphatase LpxH
MGARFDIEHINFIAYLTSKKAQLAPRCEDNTLWQFLFSMAHEVERNTISTDRDWQLRLQKRAAALVSSLSTNGRTMLPPEVAPYLDPLREFFTGYDLYALLIPGSAAGDEERLVHTYAQYVKNSAVDILVLLPYSGDAFVNVVDPFPAIRALAERPVSLPAVVFWTASEESIALTLDEADEFFANFVSVGVKGARKGSSVKLGPRIKAESKRLAVKTILHISDLHFGDAAANRRKNYLKQHLKRIAPTADRVVISGDLFDEPETEFREQFDEFHADLASVTKKAPIVIPGNHDLRKSGTAIAGFGTNSDQLTDVGFQPLVVDDDLKVVFFCFNSCEGGNFATGLVSEAQRTSRGTLFERLVHESPRIEDYIRVAIVHHHPYTYESEPTVFYEKILQYLSKKEDRFVAFNNADEFLNWCGARDVSLILHGHKHVPHVVRANINVRGKPKEILIVGCGSTTGVESKPMCYDIVSLDPVTKKWGVVFFSDATSDGAGFDPQNVTLDLRSELPTRL